MPTSSALASRIEQGAPADVFVSADTDWMDYAQARKKPSMSRRGRINLSANSIVLIARRIPVSICHIGPGLDLAKLAAPAKIATGDV